MALARSLALAGTSTVCRGSKLKHRNKSAVLQNPILQLQLWCSHWSQHSKIHPDVHLRNSHDLLKTLFNCNCNRNILKNVYLHLTAWGVTPRALHCGSLAVLQCRTFLELLLSAFLQGLSLGEEFLAVQLLGTMA